MDWPDSRYERWLEMLRLWNRVSKMQNTRWPNRILQWDRDTGTDSFYSEIKFILNYTNMDMAINTEDTISLEHVRDNLMKICRNKWAVEAYSK